MKSPLDDVARLLSQTFSPARGVVSGPFLPSTAVVQSLGTDSRSQASKLLSSRFQSSSNYANQMNDPQNLLPLEDIDSAEMERRLWELFDGASASAAAAEPSSSESGWLTYSGDGSGQLGRISIGLLEDEPSSGQITDIGKFLLDPDAVDVFEQIIRSKHVSKFVQVMEDDHAAALSRLQTYLLKQPHVLATIVIGHDGGILAAQGDCGSQGTHAERVSNDVIASWALCAYVNSRIASQIVGANLLKHLVLSGVMGTMILSDFGQALLITITTADEVEAVSSLLDKLEALLG